MVKPPFILLIILINFSYCGSPTPIDKNEVSSREKNNDTAAYKGLHGTWVLHNNSGFTLIEIKDTSNILYYQFLVGHDSIGKSSTDKVFYYKSKGKMGYWNNDNTRFKTNADIWISTDKYRFDYKVKGDTLIEVDKIGIQGILMKVNSDIEK
jgi:hypothetical protein